MSLSQHQYTDLKLKQQLSLTPQLQQAIKILNMNTQELNTEISQMLAQNFMLNLDEEAFQDEMIDREDADSDNDDESTIETLDEELPYDAEWEDHYDHSWQEHTCHQENDPNLEQYISHNHSLHSHLIKQIKQISIDAEIRLATEALIYHLDDDGYLRESPNELAKLYGLPLKQIQAAVKIIQNCQPNGVGAANLEECIYLQLSMLPKNTQYLDVLKRIMARYFMYLGRDPELIKNRLNISDEDYDGAMRLLNELNPRPGAEYSCAEVNYIKPEIIVHEKGRISYIEMDETILPSLSINKTYATLAKHARKEEKVLLQAQLNEARWFLSAIDKRMDTVKRVAGVIVAFQQEFFQEGERAMNPLTRQRVADILDIHESTVSRAVNGKYLSCKRGVYELRYFFSTQLDTNDGKESTTAVKAIIAEIIAQENPKKPLSDQKIMDILAEKEGYKIARRTIAKYREELNIPTSSERRKR